MRTKWLHKPYHVGGPMPGTEWKYGYKNLQSWRPNCGQNGEITHAIMGIPNAGTKSKLACNLCCTRFPKIEAKLKVAAQPLPSWGPQTGVEIQTSYIPLAFFIALLSWRATRGQMCNITSTVLHVPKAGTESKLATQPVPSSGPMCQQMSCETLAVIRGPLQGRNQMWPHQPYRLEGPTCGQTAYITHAIFGMTKEGTKSKWAKS